MGLVKSFYEKRFLFSFQFGLRQFSIFIRLNQFGRAQYLQIFRRGVKYPSGRTISLVYSFVGIQLRATFYWKKSEEVGIHWRDWRDWNSDCTFEFYRYLYLKTYNMCRNYRTFLYSRVLGFPLQSIFRCQKCHDIWSRIARERRTFPRTKLQFCKCG